MSAAELLRLIVRPTVPGHFQASIDTDLGPLIVVVSSRQPLVDGARRLLELGHVAGCPRITADLPLTMRHAGKDYDALPAQPIGEWARTPDSC